MLIKFFKKKIVESIIKEALNTIPELKDKVIEEIKLEGAEFLNAVYEAIKSATVEFIKKRHGK